MRWVAVGCCHLALLWASLAQAGQRADLPEPVYSTELQFVLPFELEATDPPPAVVQLYVSTDVGKTWRLSAASPPDKGHFLFKAPAVGEYCFSVRTIHRDGTASPDPAEPEMRVIVGPRAPYKRPSAVQTVAAASPVPTPAKTAAEVATSIAASDMPAMVIPQGLDPRMVNSQTFELDYNVDSLESSGVERVELWATTDGGATWSLHAVDEDRQSSLKVQVDRQGLFGFWMVVEGANGLRGSSPRGGEQPQIWVGVDTSPPVARLTTAKTRTGASGNDLTIQWEAVDMRLGATPVTLWYAAEREGPWSPLAQDIDNSGSFTTSDVGKLPEQFYLRMRVVDVSGNERVISTTERIRLAPSGVTLQAGLQGSPARDMTWFHVLR